MVSATYVGPIDAFVDRVRVAREAGTPVKLSRDEADRLLRTISYLDKVHTRALQALTILEGRGDVERIADALAEDT